MDELLDLIFELESSSGRDKKAYIPNPKSGALGGYQMKLGAFKAIQGMFPEKWKDKKFKDVALDDKQSRDAAGDYIKFNMVSLGNDYGVAARGTDILLGAYKEGAGGVISRDPDKMARVKEYVDKAHGIRSRWTEPLAR